MKLCDICGAELCHKNRSGLCHDCYFHSTPRRVREPSAYLVAVEQLSDDDYEMLKRADNGKLSDAELRHCDEVLAERKRAVRVARVQAGAI